MSCCVLNLSFWPFHQKHRYQLVYILPEVSFNVLVQSLRERKIQKAEVELSITKQLC